ncbi:MAG TPA: PAS domain S-box protein, partial [Chthonomonadaceae bacterium]|nr:PAS domain S-box protein [Chthonomonadaceae bacterium]
MIEKPHNPAEAVPEGMHHDQAVVEAQSAETAQLTPPFAAEALFDASPVPAWIVDAETLTFLAVNGAACRHYGYTDREIAGMSLLDLCCEDDAPKCLKQIAGGPAGLDAQDAVRHLRRDGTVIDVVASRHPTIYNGRRAVLSILSDVTDRRRHERAVEQKEALLRAILDHSPSAVSLKDASGRFLLVNRAFERLTGHTATEAIGKTHGELFDSALGEFIARNHRTVVETGAALEHEESGIVDGRSVTFLTQRFPLLNRHGEVYAVCGISTDITERKRDELAREFLSDATEALAGSLDYEETLHRVAKLAVPQIADWCAVDMVLDDGTVRLLALEHVDPTKLELGYALRREYPPDPGEKLGLVNVIRTCRSEIYPTITDEFLVASAKDARHLEIARGMGLRSAMVVPIVARERALGAITFVTTHETGREYTHADLVQAEGLAARAALAIENARLYRAAQVEIAERARVQEALENSEKRFRFALANSDIAVYTQDRDLRYVWAYNGATNAELPDIYGKTDAEILAHDHATALTEIKRRVQETGIEERHVVGAQRLGQEFRYYDTSFAPLRDESGAVVGVTGTVNDVTTKTLAQDA